MKVNPVCYVPVEVPDVLVDLDRNELGFQRFLPIASGSAELDIQLNCVLTQALSRRLNTTGFVDW